MMAVTARELISWAQTLKPETLVGVSEDGMGLTTNESIQDSQLATENGSHWWFEIGMMPREDVEGESPEYARLGVQDPRD